MYFAHNFHVFYLKNHIKNIFGLVLFFQLASTYSQSIDVEVKRFEVHGNTLLESRQLNQVLGVLPRKMTSQSIQQTAQDLQQAYRNLGYGAVVVLVPEQTLTGGTLRFDVIEGKLRQIQVTGQQNFSTANILRSLPSLQIGQTPRLSELDSQLLMANENPAKTMRVVFQPGERRGDVEGLVVVEEQPHQRLLLGLDNTGNNSTGNYRAHLNYQHANVADRDIVWGIRASTSPTQVSDVLALGTTLRVPLYRQKTFIEGSLLASNTRSANNMTPAGELRFSGSGLAIGARVVWTLPSLSETKRQASVGVEARSYRSQCSLGDLGEAGCGLASHSINVLPLTAVLVWQQQGRHSVAVEWIANLRLGNAGNDAKFEAARPGARSNYQLLRLNAYVQRKISDDWSLSARANAQWSNQPLVSAEQFGAGGSYSVRGYEERALNTDAGVTASLELRRALPLFTGGKRSPETPTIGVFMDAAHVRNKHGTACQQGRTECQLLSFGAGLRYLPTPGTTFRLDLARTGIAVNNTSAGEWRLHFNMSYDL